MAAKRKRLVGSVKAELLKKSREAALAAVQIFNNPNITFKSETFTVLMIIAWTYLFHAYYRAQHIEYRYYSPIGNRRRFHKTKHGADKHWELERCISDENSPLDKDTANNLRFLIGLRHEIEHQMTTRIDDSLSAKFQACCLNYDHYMKALFGVEYGIERHLSFSLQFSTIGTDQKDVLQRQTELPAHIRGYLDTFERSLSDDEYSSQRYAYRILFVPKVVNRKGQADQVIEFVKSDSSLAQDVNRAYALIKEIERLKYLPSSVVKLIKSEGYIHFGQHQHTELWKQLDGKNPGKGYGVEVQKTWYWYETWVNLVREHCRENASKYT